MAYSKYKGKFTPKNPEKYVGDVNAIVYRSKLELRYFAWCDRSSHILSWNSEGWVVPYRIGNEKKTRRYFVDLWLKVKTKNGIKEYLVEIKPQVETKKPRKRKNKVSYEKALLTWVMNEAKWEAAEKFAKKHGKKFIILTEKDI